MNGISFLTKIFTFICIILFQKLSLLLSIFSALFYDVVIISDYKASNSRTISYNALERIWKERALVYNTDIVTAFTGRD
jgi:hypothetical protein